MSKNDIPDLPDRVPAKRRQVEQLLDVHIAKWLASDAITPSQRRRLEAEKARRKALSPERPVGLLVGREGVTPIQTGIVLEQLAAAQPTEIHHPGVAGSLHSACKKLGVPVTPVRNLRGWQMGLPPLQGHGSDDDAMRRVVHLSTHLVIGAPKEYQPTKGSPVWDMVRHAKHRRVAVKVILPDGKIYNEDDGT